MPDIHHCFRVYAPAGRVFECFTTAEGLNAWWTQACRGEPFNGTEYELCFGPGHNWRGVVTACKPCSLFELEIMTTDPDWNCTRVGFTLKSRENFTEVNFYHTGWPQANDHYRTSNYCWAMYLRLLKRHAETGEIVPYENRLDA